MNEKFMELLERQLTCKNDKEAFEISIELARLAGVPEDKIIHNLDEADAFFNGTEELKFE